MYTHFFIWKFERKIKYNIKDRILTLGTPRVFEKQLTPWGSLPPKTTEVIKTPSKKTPKMLQMGLTF